jgi:hypothetical protein
MPKSLINNTLDDVLLRTLKSNQSINSTDQQPMIIEEIINKKKLPQVNN